MRSVEMARTHDQSEAASTQGRPTVVCRCVQVDSATHNIDRMKMFQFDIRDPVREEMEIWQSWECN